MFVGWHHHDDMAVVNDWFQIKKGFVQNKERELGLHN